MRAGREFDMMIATEVMGHSLVKQKHGPYVEGTPAGVRPLKPYTKDLEAAFEVANKVGISLIPIEGGQWFALCGTGERWRSPASFLEFLQKGDFINSGAAVGEDAALTICIAAIKSVEKKKALLDEAAANPPSDNVREIQPNDSSTRH